MVSCHQRVQDRKLSAGFAAPNQPLSTSQTKCQPHTDTAWNICMFRCKTCPFRARTPTPARNFPATKMILVYASISRVQHNLETLPPEPCAVHTPALPCSCHLLVPPDYQQGFFGGKNQPNSMKRQVLFVCNMNFTSTTSVGKDSDNGIE